MKRDKKLWRRLLATFVIAATLLAGLDASLLESVLAEDKSGYKVEVAYSKDKSQASLKGNTDSLGAGVTLGELKDKDGNIYDPSDFETTVTDNGTYTYTLTYKETAAQSGKELDKEEKIEVKVDQITAPAGNQTEPDSAGSASSANTLQDESGTSGEIQGEAPSVVALSTLLAAQRSSANTVQTKNLYLYAEEAISQRLASEPFVFSGGELNKQTVPEYNGYTGVDENAELREFSYAAFVYLDEESEDTADLPYTITGLYYYSDVGAWYYTTEGSKGTQPGDYGTISAAYRLPDNVDLRLYYGVGAESEHQLTNNITNVSWELRGLDAGVTTVKHGYRVLFELSLNSLWQYGFVTVRNETDNTDYYYVLRRGNQVADSTLNNRFGEGNWEDAQVLDEDTSRYRVAFTMPSSNVTVNATSVNWEVSDLSYFGIAIARDIASEASAYQNGERGATRFYETARNASGWRDNGGNANGLTLTGIGTVVGGSGFQDRGPTYSKNANQTGGFGNLEVGSAMTRPFVMLDFTYSNNTSRTYGYYVQQSSYRLGRTFFQPSIMDGQLQNQTVVWNPWDSSTKGTVAIGEASGNRVHTFRVEESRHRYRDEYPYPNDYVFIPYSLDIDVYYGDFGSADFERYTLQLGTASGTHYTMELPNGAKVTAICRRNAGDASIREATDYWGNSLRMYNPSDLNLVNSAHADEEEPRWYIYDVVVEGMTTPFKLTYNHVSGTQSNYVVKSMDGVVQSDTPSAVEETSGVTSSSINGSYVYAQQDTNNRWRNEYRPLRVGDILQAKHELNSGDYSGAFQFGLEPMEGYTRPKVTVTKRSDASSTLADAVVTEIDEVDSFGRYLYKVDVNAERDDTFRNLSGTIDISAQPITFEVEYRSSVSSGKFYPSGSSGTIALKYGGTENYVLTMQRQNTTDLVRGYNMTIRYDGKTLADISAPSDNGSKGSYWLPGDVVNVRNIYQQLDEAGALTSVDSSAGAPTYYIVLVPVLATDISEGGYSDNIGYEVYTQSGWSEAYASDLNQYSTSNDGFNITTGFIGGFVGSTVTFGGFENRWSNSAGAAFVLDRNKSILQGIAIDKQIVGRFYYLRTASVNIRVPTDLESDSSFARALSQITQWNKNNGTADYVGLTTKDPNLSHTVDLSSINLPETVDSGRRRLSGWRVLNANDENGTNSYVFSGSSLNLCSMGTRDGKGETLWDAIFASGGSGRIVIEPYYELAYGPIEAAGETSRTVNTHTGEGFDVSAVFKYDGAWAGNRNALKIALYRNAGDSQNKKWGEASYNSATGAWIVTRVTGNSGNKLSATVDVKADEQANTFAVTFRIQNVVQGGGHSVQYNWEDSDGPNRTDYRIYAWTDANSENEITAADGSPPGSEVPGYINYVNVRPAKIETDMSAGGSHGQATSDGVYHSIMPEQSATVGAALTISASFSGDKLYPTNLQRGSTAIEEGKLRIALFRKSNSDTDWQLWATENGATGAGVDGTVNKVGTPEVTIENGNNTQGKVTVSFVLEGAYIGQEDFEYCIAVWNNTNTGGSTVPADSFKPSDTEGEYLNIPSVRRTIKPGWESANIYVVVPQKIMLSADRANLGAGADTTGYVGNSETISLSAALPDGTAIESYPRIQVSTAKNFGISNLDDARDYLTVGVYSGTGGSLTEDPDRADHLIIGTLDENNKVTELTYWLNAKLPTGLNRGDSYIGFMTYHFDNLDGTGGGNG
nr:hypothetical protein [uncultured Mediterraneibacter sp.]